MLKIAGVIPARLASTRFPEKVLKLIGGRPMIQHVWERAARAKKLSSLVVACDDRRIYDCVQAFGGKALLTRPDHPNGTARVAEAAAGMDAGAFVNIQGDEPLMDPANIDALAGLLEADAALQVATLAVARRDEQGYQNPNVVKVVCDAAGYALYFSRAPLPHRREAAGDVSYLKHLGIYAYRRDFLLQFVKWQTGDLEQTEKLEQLRILERGVNIRVALAAADSQGVDTAEDFAAVEKILKNSANCHSEAEGRRIS